jgi:hypothetical protein
MSTTDNKASQIVLASNDNVNTAVGELPRLALAEQLN